MKRGMSDSLPLPYSYQIMGTIVETLGIQDEILTGSTAKRFYKGESVNKHDLGAIYRQFGKVLVDLGIIPNPPLFLKTDLSMSKVISEATIRFLFKWDKLLAIIQSRSASRFDAEEATVQILRLVVIDLALRTFAYYLVSQIRVPEPEIPLWAEENGAGKSLRILLTQAGINRDQFAARLGVSSTSIDNWFDGKIIPKPENIFALAKEFSILLPTKNQQALNTKIKREFVISGLLNKLAESVGRYSVIELAEAFNHLVGEITKDVESMNRQPIEDAADKEFEILRLGSDSFDGRILLRNLLLVESDQDWQRDLMAASIDWSLRFQEIISESASLRTAAGLAQDIHDVDPKFQDEAEHEIQELKKSMQLKSSDYLTILQGDLNTLNRLFNEEVNKRRMIVKRYPLSPQAHWLLGSYLGMVGKWLRNRKLIDEGISECNLAAALFQDWDNPVVEPAIILSNAGFNQEALGSILIAQKTLKIITPHLVFVYGYILMELGKYEEALAKFKIVIEARPDYALTYTYASECAFKTGNRHDGREFAKKARNLGEPKAYFSWKKGELSK
jgi:transcriptional regulator with XRE-family HTH domain